MTCSSRFMCQVMFSVFFCAITAILLCSACTRRVEQAPQAGPGKGKEQAPAPAAQPEKVQPAETAEKPSATAPEAPGTATAELSGPLFSTVENFGRTPPPAPKVSTFAPAEDLVRQLERYVEGLEKIVADEEEYKDGKEKIAKDANTLIIIALALGLHDEPNKYQAHAGAIMAAANRLAATIDRDSALKAVAVLREAVAGKHKVQKELHWGKAASLPELMKQVPLLNTRLKRYLKGERFKSKARDSAGLTAVIAAIAQGSLADTSQAKDAEQAQKWYNYSVAMRDSAGELNAAIRKGDEAAAAEAMKKLTQSCDDCHTVFHPEAKDLTVEDEGD